MSEYDPHDDFAKSLDHCYAVIRERTANGGKGWEPKYKTGKQEDGQGDEAADTGEEDGSLKSHPCD